MLWSSSKHGTPRYKPGVEGKNSAYRVYCRLSRDSQGYTATPGHRLRRRRAKGVTSGDLVRYHHSHHGIVRGYARHGQPQHPRQGQGISLRNP